MQLSEHFTLAEMVFSREAAIHRIDNTPPPHVVKNLVKTCLVAEELRAILGGLPWSVSSGYRCPKLNLLVGGKPTSAHLDGSAMDFNCFAFGPPERVFSYLKSVLQKEKKKLLFDQLIIENTWVHLGVFNRNGFQRRQFLDLRSKKNG